MASYFRKLYNGVVSLTSKTSISTTAPPPASDPETSPALPVPSPASLLRQSIPPNDISNRLEPRSGTDTPPTPPTTEHIHVFPSPPPERQATSPVPVPLPSALMLRPVTYLIISTFLPLILLCDWFAPYVFGNTATHTRRRSVSGYLIAVGLGLGVWANGRPRSHEGPMLGQPSDRQPNKAREEPTDWEDTLEYLAEAVESTIVIPQVDSNTTSSTQGASFDEARLEAIKDAVLCWPTHTPTWRVRRAWGQVLISRIYRNFFHREQFRQDTAAGDVSNGKEESSLPSITDLKYLQFSLDLLASAIHLQSTPPSNTDAKATSAGSTAIATPGGRADNLGLEHMMEIDFLNHELGKAWFEQYNLTSDTSSLSEAISALSTAIELRASRSQAGLEGVPAAWYWGVGVMHRQRWQTKRDSSSSVDVEAAVRYLEVAVRLQEQQRQSGAEEISPSLLVDLGMGFLRRYEAMGQLEDLQQAVGVAKEGKPATPDVPAPDSRIEFVNALVETLINRWWAAGQNADPNDLVTAWEFVDELGQVPSDHPYWPASQINIGDVYFMEFQSASMERRAQQVHPLLTEGAILAYEAALTAHTSLDPVAKAKVMYMLGAAFLSRFQDTADEEKRDPADLEQSVAWLEESVRGTSDDHPEKVVRLTMVSNCYYTRYGQSIAPEDLGKSIRTLEEAQSMAAKSEEADRDSEYRDREETLKERLGFWYGRFEGHDDTASFEPLATRLGLADEGFVDGEPVVG